MYKNFIIISKKFKLLFNFKEIKNIEFFYK